ncbi:MULTISPECIES: YraN family protein [unclassified Clostridium]|uniref:YraN family protein n=1 Tax=unclassified Clostridium TaxID=2614128 RepID=UPI0018998745|nr:MULTISPECIES: YraN family protein [unclassified Clostridium]MCR1951524.1 YraN family protein [Clostridium sp. DSM 100503]
MSKFNKCIGSYGEDLASSYLKSKGYYILKKNFRNKYGEIDLICRHDGLIIFVEVKSRYNYNYGLPCESVTSSKQKQIINLCKFYILTRKLFNYNCRFDVVEIYFNSNNESYLLNHIEDAFRGY